MNRETKRTLTPRLRFPEFRDNGGWHAQPISSVLSKVSEAVSVAPDETYREIGIRSHGKGIFHKEPTSGKVIGTKRVFRVVKDAFVVNIIFAWEQAVATTSAREEGMIASHRFPMYVAKPGKCDVQYINRFFLTKNGKHLLGLASPGGAGRNRTLGQKEFEKLQIVLPEAVAEQRKIAACLGSLDDWIGAELRKLEALRSHKKGLMQQLFPRPGESRPRLRFPEFQDAGEWEEKPLGEIFETMTGGTPERTVKEYWNGKIPWVTTSLVDFNTIYQAEEFITEAGLENSSAKLFPKGTILMALYGQGKTRGKVALLGIEATTNQACAAIFPRDDFNTAFTFLSLCGRYDELRRLSNSGGQENLSQSLVRALPFRYPSDAAEQQRIAACLSSLDEMLAAQSRKVEGLKGHKKGLMQQLFPSGEGKR